MSKIFAKFLPLLDQVYIFQLLEYDLVDFWHWTLNHPFERNLQRKKRIEFTSKVVLILIFSYILMLFSTVFIFKYTSVSIFLLPVVILFLHLFSPAFIAIAFICYLPLDIYYKSKIMNSAKVKLSNLKNLKVIAITGSFGKTSTKDILYTLLKKKYYVVKTPKSFNTQLGIARTISDLKTNTNIFICEIGAYRIGEIAKICQIIKPDIGIVTAIAPQHLQKFGSLENIAKAKFELPKSLPRKGGAILNSSYDMIKLHAKALETKVIFYGSRKDPFFATNIKNEIWGTSFILHTPKGKINITIPLIGEHHVSNFLAASGAAINLGLTLPEIKERAKLLLPTPHRMEIRTVTNIILIDNSYNTNPESARSSLKLLESFDKNRKIVITPGFIELGKKAYEENKKFGAEVGSLADEVIIVGENAKKDLVDGLKENHHPVETIHFIKSTNEALGLAQELSKGIETVVLLENDLPDQYF